MRRNVQDGCFQQFEIGGSSDVVTGRSKVSLAGCIFAEMFMIVVFDILEIGDNIHMVVKRIVVPAMGYPGFGYSWTSSG